MSSIIYNLTPNTPYRIVVEARDNFGATSQARLLVYAAPKDALSTENFYIPGVRGVSSVGSAQVTVTWDPVKGAQAYLIQVKEEENQFGGVVFTDNILKVVCTPGLILCNGKDQFAEELEDNKLKYTLQVNKEVGNYQLVVVPFSFIDLIGLQASDEEGKIKTFTEGVLELVEKESDLSTRVQNTLKDTGNINKIEIDVNKAGAPVDLELESTGSTISASWGHGKGAEVYYAIITSDDETNAVAVTNTLNRYDASGKFVGGGYTIFTNLVADTLYTVTVQSLAVVDRTNNIIGEEVSGRLSTKDAEDILDDPLRISRENLILNREEGKLKIKWNTPEFNSVIGYNVFYWVGDIPPDKPQYVAGKGKTDLSFTVQPNSYNVRVDVLSTSPGQEVVVGGIKYITIYGKPSAPRDLGVMFFRGNFANINNKLYAIGYPLIYTKADTPVEAGGPLTDVSYHYRYRVAGGEWVGYNKIEDEAMISLLVNDLGDAAVVKSGYGKRYQVEMFASNIDGYVSEKATLEFAYKSFPEPFVQSENLKVATGDRSLTVSWPAVREVNGSTVANYTVVLSDGPYALPLRSTNTVERRVVFEGLENNQNYFITVVPNGAVTGNIFFVLSADNFIKSSDPKRKNLDAYIGDPLNYIPQGYPEAVVNLEVISGKSTATVTWRKPTEGTPATRYILEYLKGVPIPITHLYAAGDDVDAELKELSWKGAVFKEVKSNETGEYAVEIDNLNTSSATNVFRVRGEYVNDSGKRWPGEYRYYAIGTDSSRPPSLVELTFTSYATGSFRVVWTKPSNPGVDKDINEAQLAGYRVSWGTTEELGESYEIDDPDTLSYTITGLTPGTLHYVKVQAKNDNSEGNIYNVGSTGSTYTTKPPEPVAVSSIAYSEHTVNGFKVTWDGVTDAGYGPEGKYAPNSIGYKVEWSSNQGVDWESISRHNQKATEDIFNSLIPGVFYRVRITATNDFDIASSVEGEDTSTLSLPGQVESLVVMDPSYDKTLNQGGFKVRWSAPTSTGVSSTGREAAITGYTVSYAEMGAAIGEYATAPHESTNTEYVFTGLKPHTGYYVRIQAKTAAGTGARNFISGWTPSLPGAVAPDSILFSDPTAYTIKIKWTAPQAGGAGGNNSVKVANQYKVEIAPEGSDTYALVEDDYSGTSITATNLNRLTTYRARITAKNKWGEAGRSVSTETGNTENILAPVNFRKIKTCYDYKSARIDWDVSSEATYYKLYRDAVEIATSITTNTYLDTGLNSKQAYTYKVQACSAGDCSPESDSLEIVTLDDRKFIKIVDSGKIDFIRDDFQDYDVRVHEILDSYRNNNSYSYRSILVKYFKPDGSGDGSSFDQAAGEKDMKTIIEEMHVQTPFDSIGMVFLIGGIYKAGSSIQMGSNVAIIGGLDECLEFSDTPTVLDGENTYQVINNDRLVLSSSLLYGVTVANGKSSKNGGGMFNDSSNIRLIRVIFSNNSAQYGGGMYNDRGASPILDKVTFSGNTATYYGGGMYNYNSSLSLGGVAFSGNTAGYGGGMYNDFISSPSLSDVTFSGNKANNGGGMYNNGNSRPSLSDVTFSVNEAVNNGGGIFNQSSSPSLFHVTFSGNTADYGGGMYENNNGEEGSLIINGIFWGNTASVGGKQFYFLNDSTNQENLRIYNSIVEGGTGDLVSEMTNNSVNQGGLVSGGGSAPVVISFANITNTDPQLGDLADNGGSVWTHAIQSDSPAVNQGLYVRIKRDQTTNTFYYSKDDTDWYAKPDLSGTAVTVPAGAEDLTATDATGYIRTEEPDLGAYEAR